MKNIRQVTFHHMTPLQADEVGKLVEKAKSPYPELFGLVIVCMLPFALFSIVTALQSKTGFARCFPYAAVMLMLAALLYQDSYHRKYRIKCCRSGKVTVANVVCIDIRTQYTGHRYHVSYYFKNAEGESFKLKGRSLLRSRPDIGTRCQIVNFGNKYYSVM